jgi:hypothetical protein
MFVLLSLNGYTLLTYHFDYHVLLIFGDVPVQIEHPLYSLVLSETLLHHITLYVKQASQIHHR